MRSDKKRNLMKTDGTTEREALQDLILKAFITAQRQRESDAAEHLLLALEVLDRDDASHEITRRRHLREAYSSLMRPPDL